MLKTSKKEIFWKTAGNRSSYLLCGIAIGFLFIAAGQQNILYLIPCSLVIIGMGTKIYKDYEATIKELTPASDRFWHKPVK